MIAGSYLLCTVLPLYLQIFNEGSRCEGRVGGPGIRPRVGSVAREKSNRLRCLYRRRQRGRAVLPYDIRCARQLPEKAREFRPFLKRRFENSLCLIPFFAMWPVVPLADVVRRNAALCSWCSPSRAANSLRFEVIFK